MTPASTDGAGPAPELRTTVALLTSTVAIDAGRRAWAARLRELLAPFVVPSGEAVAAEPAATFSVHDVGGRDGGSVDDAVLLRGGIELVRGSWRAIEARLLVELNATAIGAYDGFAVHAGVVARGDDAICFPGPSGSGKSTLTAACLAAGFDYVSDEALCIDPATATVVPYPRPIALSPASVALVGLAPSRTGAPAAGERDGDGASDAAPDGDDREVLVGPDCFGSLGVQPSRRLRLAHVVELRRGATEALLEPLHRSLAVPVLLSMSFNHFKAPGASLDVVGALARHARVWRLHHDDPIEAAMLLAQTLG
jgi:hypothetical protein